MGCSSFWIFFECLSESIEPIEIVGGPLNSDSPFLHYLESSWKVKPNFSLMQMDDDLVPIGALFENAARTGSSFSFDSADSTFRFRTTSLSDIQTALLVEDPVSGALLPQPRSVEKWRVLCADDKHAYRRLCWNLESGLDEIRELFGEPDSRVGPIMTSDHDRSDFGAENVRDVFVYERIHECAVVFFRLFESGRVSVSFGLKPR
jgi:hypothetical protein